MMTKLANANVGICQNYGAEVSTIQKTTRSFNFEMCVR